MNRQDSAFTNRKNNHGASGNSKESNHQICQVPCHKLIHLLPRIGTNDSAMVGMEGVVNRSAASEIPDEWMLFVEGILDKGISGTLWILFSKSGFPCESLHT